MKKLVAGITATSLLFFASACAGAASRETLVPTFSEPGDQRPPVTTVAPMPTSPSKGEGETGGTIVPDRMIVRIGNMAIVVEDIIGAVDTISRLAETYEGYVVNSQTWREGERLMGTITIRVPAGDFERVMSLISDLAVDVKSQSTSSQDVTEEYTDLTAKLMNLEAAEQQLLKIMEKAEKVEDILAVQRELTRVRGEIEQAKGRMQYLERTSSTSLIDVQLEQSKLDADFNASTTVLEGRQSVRFFAKIAGGFSPYSYEWDFGDGGTSTLAQPVHEYRARGSYTVTLKVTDDHGNSDTVIRNDYINVISGWSITNIIRSAWDSLVSFSQGLAGLLVTLIIWSPVWLAIGGALFWLFRRMRGKFKSWFGGG